MSAYLRTRLLQALPTVLIVTILVFLMLHLTPSDPAEIFIGEAPSTPELLARVREDMGLNQPLHIQYLRWLLGDMPIEIGGVTVWPGREVPIYDAEGKPSGTKLKENYGILRGDFGKSLRYKLPVLEMITDRIPHTVELALAAFAISTFLGVTLGMVAALKRGTIMDTGSMTLALLGISIPVYWSALMLILILSVNLKLFPPIGQGSLDRLILPALALSLVSAGTLARMVRSSMLEVLNQDYVVTARAKGLTERVVILRHTLRNALIPVVTVLGLTIGNLLGGAVLTETIFARLGIGRMFAEGVQSKDFTVVQGTALFVALVYVIINIAIDLLYVFIDPRIKYD
jgi:ABC-type dipeptide/oligopeptide/nickel transport system permease component